MDTIDLDALSATQLGDDRRAISGHDELCMVELERRIRTTNRRKRGPADTMRSDAQAKRDPGVGPGDPDHFEHGIRGLLGAWFRRLPLENGSMMQTDRIKVLPVVDSAAIDEQSCPGWTWPFVSHSERINQIPRRRLRRRPSYGDAIAAGGLTFERHLT